MMQTFQLEHTMNTSCIVYKIPFLIFNTTALRAEKMKEQYGSCRFVTTLELGAPVICVLQTFPFVDIMVQESAAR